MLSNEPKFVSVSDFFNYWGIDLNAKLKGFDNLSNKGNLFLARVERNLLNYVDARTYRNYIWENLEGKQLEGLQTAILEQAMYVYRNGDVSLDSGYDPTKGRVEDRNYLDTIAICEPALNALKNAGLYNQVMHHKRRYTRFF